MTGASSYIISRLEQELETLPVQNNEITQHFIELGYIPLFKVNAIRNADLAEAKKVFLKELSESEIFPLDFTEKLLPSGEEYMLNTFLRKLTDIDEGITIDAFPVKGEKNLLSRLIHYRLDLFGLWPMDVAAPFSNLSIQKLKELAYFSNSTELEAFNHLADIEKFTRHLLEIHPAEKFILVFRSAKVSEETRKKLHHRQAFKNQLLDDFGERSEFFKYLSHEILKNNPAKIDFGFLNKESLDPFKQFVLRLIQVHQWQEGFYNGLLDSDMGEVSLQSLLDAVGFYNNSENKNIKTHRILTYLHDGYFIYNSLFFLQEYMIEDQESDAPYNELSILENIRQQLDGANEEEQTAFTNNIEKLKSDIYSDAGKEPAERKGFLQRIYFGIKRILKKAFRFVRKIYSWIKDRVLKAWDFLKTLFRDYFENLRLGIKAFVDGINFLFGDHAIASTVNGELIVSKFSGDGDAMSVTSAQISQVIGEHLETLGYSIKSMKFTLAVVGGILKIIINMVSIITWPLLLLNIIKIYKTISTAYQEIKLT